MVKPKQLLRGQLANISQGLECISQAFEGNTEALSIVASQPSILLAIFTAVLDFLSRLVGTTSSTVQAKVQQVKRTVQLWEIVTQKLAGGLRKGEFKFTDDQAKCLCQAYRLLAESAVDGSDEKGEEAVSIVINSLEREPDICARLHHPLSVITLKIQSKIAEVHKHL